LEAGVGLELRVIPLADYLRAGRNPEVWMEFCPSRPLDAVRRPRPSPCLEGDVIRWMPVSGEEDRKPLVFEGTYDPVESGDHLVAALDGEGSARAEIPLDIHY